MVPWSEIERVLKRDPAKRGLVSFEQKAGDLCPGHLRAAAESLATAEVVGIVTGFCVVDRECPAAETDGPPGALFLARALNALGVEVILISDEYGMPLLEVGCRKWELEGARLVEFPFDPLTQLVGKGDSCSPDEWVAWFFREGPGKSLSHLIAIERVGPSHDLDSFLGQPREGAPPRDSFEKEVSPASHNLCHNMRGIPIDTHTAEIHRLFDYLARNKLPITTIGIGDGGNEIGLGSIPWEILREAIAFGPAGRIACRVATDYTLLAGVSNWAAYALATGVCAVREQTELLAPWDCRRQEELISALVHEAGAVDGVTKECQATVDGLPLQTYLQALASIRRTMGLEP